VAHLKVLGREVINEQVSVAILLDLKAEAWVDVANLATGALCAKGTARKSGTDGCLGDVDHLLLWGWYGGLMRGWWEFSIFIATEWAKKKEWNLYEIPNFYMSLWKHKKRVFIVFIEFGT
jgi:hypothetical protein